VTATLVETNTFLRTFAINDTSFAEIVAPADCSYYTLIPTDDNAWVRSSDPSVTGAQVSMKAGESYSLTAPFIISDSARYSKGDVVAYVKAVSAGTKSIVCEFIP
jgi:hypothetical protein